jgi:hypothetical protein
VRRTENPSGDVAWFVACRIYIAWFEVDPTYSPEIHLLHTGVRRGIIRGSAPGRGEYRWRFHDEEVYAFDSGVFLDGISAGGFNPWPKRAKEEQAEGKTRCSKH